MMKVRYATLMREPGPGAVPKQGLIECGYTKGYTPKGQKNERYNQQTGGD